MTLEVGKESIDIGIVVRDIQAALKFYRNTVGLEYAAEMPAGGGRMHRLMCGSTVVKLVIHDQVPDRADNSGGPLGASGIRYWTITVTDLQAITDKCREAGIYVGVGMGSSATTAKRWHAAGAHWAMVGADYQYMVQFADNLYSEIRSPEIP